MLFLPRRERNFRKKPASVVLFLLGDWRGALSWSGDSHGVRGSVVRMCHICKCLGSGVIAPRKQLKTHLRQVFQADISTGLELKTGMAARTC